MRNRSFRRSARQVGFSLIELMVAIAIALFIIGAVLVMYLNMKSTFNTQDSLAQLQDSERLSLTMLTNTVQSAGYFVNPLSNTVSAALPGGSVTWGDTTTSTFAAGQFVTGTSGSGATASDTVAVQYQTASGDGLMNCQGGVNTSGSNAVFSNRFAVSASNELTCYFGSAAGVVLGSNIYQMKIAYGVDTDGDGKTDTYMPASGVSAASLWSNVYTAQVTISFLDPTKSTASTPVPLPNPVVQTINLMNRQ